MDKHVLYSSEFIEITLIGENCYIESFKVGFSLAEFNNIIKNQSDIKVTSYITARTAIQSAPQKPAKFGEKSDRIIVEVSPDELTAYVTIFGFHNELENNRSELLKIVLQTLGDNGVVFGIRQDLINYLAAEKRFTAAVGIKPQDGADSRVEMFKMKEIKPEIKHDGNVDQYELNLINMVKKGDWLASRTDPTPGIFGMSVRGRKIPAKNGVETPLLYDKKSVEENRTDGLTTLHAAHNGAVHFIGDSIGVSNHLEIDGNVGFKVGNVDFDEFVTIRGTVEDNFSVLAGKDIEILGQYGIGSVKVIESREGSVYIRGGIAGKNQVIIKAKKDVYTKYVSDAAIISEGTVHIGLYAMNSTITAKQVILDSTNGQIIGGEINAEFKVSSPIVGSQAEKRTIIIIKGFDRSLLQTELENIEAEISETKNKILLLKSVKNNISSELLKLNSCLTLLLKRQHELREYLKTRGDGEVQILNKGYPNIKIQIKDQSFDVKKEILKTTFYIKDEILKEI